MALRSFHLHPNTQEDIAFPDISSCLPGGHMMGCETYQFEIIGKLRKAVV